MKKLLISAVILLISISLPLTARGSNEDIVFKVETKKIKFENFKESRDFKVKLFSNRELELVSPVTGTVDKVLVIDGEWVTKGQKLLYFSRTSIEREIEKSEKDVLKWQKILIARQNWRVREKRAEREAEKNLRNAKKILEANKLALGKINIKTTIEGKVQKIVSPKEAVKRGDFLASITDDYIMKIPVPKGSETYFNEGIALDISIKGIEGTFLGRVKKTKKGVIIFVNNPKLVLSNGMEAGFRATKKYENLILLEKDDFGRDKGGYYVYRVKERSGKKRYITATRFPGEKILVKSGLTIADTIVSPMVESSADTINLSQVKKTESYLKPENKTSYEPKTKKKKESFTLNDKKMEYVVSSGFSIIKPIELFHSSSGTESMISQYSEFYGLNESSDGVFKENFLGILFNLTVNYKLSEDLFLKFGAEYSTFGNTSSKVFRLEWTDITENFDYKFENKISNIMPFVGIEKRFSSFGIYALIGFNLTSLTHNRGVDYTENGYSMKENNEYKVSGSGIGIVLGGKYMIKIGKKNGVFIKLEYSLAKTGSFNGDRITTTSDSTGANFSGTQSGSLYTYDFDPYGMGAFDWWEIHENSPSGSNIKDEKGFVLDLSRIRLLIGFAF
ncbi:MAG: efflux RND transporter periplasmic adaptor subunit [Acidobacteriota bacterium]